MDRNLAIRRLCWKEYRQLLPLILVLIALGFLLHLLCLTSLSNDLAFRQSLVLVGLPGLFAVGAGALLVGQEKELRTLLWLQSLPISKGVLIRVKFGAGLIGLLLIWLFSAASYGVARSVSYHSSVNVFGWDQGSEWFWPLHTLFLLGLGYATAWRLKSPMLSLLVLIPLAISPYLLSLIAMRLLYAEPLHVVSMKVIPFWIQAPVLILGIVGVTYYGWKAAQRELGAIERPVASRWSFSREAIWVSRSSALSRPIYSQGAALIWQFVFQNLSALILIVLLYAFAWMILINGGWELAALQAFLATSWLGILTFQGDQIGQRIRFLSDRGVSPAKVWLTRQWIPLAIFAVACIVFLGSHFELRPYSRIPTGLFGLLVVAVGALTLSLSQWVGQLSRSSIVSAIVAPLMSLAAWFYLSTTTYLFGMHPAWLLLLCIAPWAITWAMMNSWMDGKVGWLFSIRSIALLVAIFLLPMLPVVVRLTTTTWVPRRVVLQFQEEIKSLGPRSIPFVLESKIATPGGELNGEGLGSTEESVATRNEQSQQKIRTNQEVRERRLKQIRSSLASNAGPVQRSQAVHLLLSDALFLRMQLRSNIDSESARIGYRDRMETLVQIVQRLRLSPDLMDQGQADWMERWLLNELDQPTAQSDLGEELLRNCGKMLGDRLARRQARLRAILFAWKRSGTLNNDVVDSLQVQSGPTLFMRLSAQRQCWLLRDYLLAEGADERMELAIVYAKETQRAHIPFVAPKSSELKLSGSEGELLPSASPFHFAQHWHGTWEKRAEDFAQSLK